MRRLFQWKERDRRHLHDELQALLPSHRETNISSAIPAHEVTYVALRLKYQIEQVIPCELPEERVSEPHSNVLTNAVIKTAKSVCFLRASSCRMHHVLQHCTLG